MHLSGFDEQKQGEQVEIAGPTYRHVVRGHSGSDQVAKAVHVHRSGGDAYDIALGSGIKGDEVETGL